MRRSLACLFALLPLAAPAAESSEKPAVVQDERDVAYDLAAVTLEMSGGRRAHAALRRLRVAGTTRTGENTLAFVLHAERPARLRIETLEGALSLVRATDGTHSPWARKGPAGSGTPLLLPAGEEADFIAEADFDPPYYEPERRGLTLRHEGDGSVEGRPAQRVRMRDASGLESLLYIDDETRLLVRREISRRHGDRALVIATDYEDHRPCGGVLLPRLIRTRVNGRIANETRISSIEANPDLPENIFSPPVSNWPLQTGPAAAPNSAR